ncbi:hypothetical protein FRB98_007321, partial [Tulasnella sp. 332]
NDGSGRDRNLSFEKQPLKVRFEKVKRKFLYASSPSDSIAHPSSVGGSSNGSQPGDKRDEKRQVQEDAEDGDEWMVDKVVVDGDFGGAGSRSSQHHNARSDSHNDTSGRGNGNQTLDPSELADSLMRAHRGVRSCGDVMQLIYQRMSEFFHPLFVDEEAERQYQKEQWHNTKLLAWITTGFLYLNWVLYLIQNHSVSLYEKVAYYGFGTLITLPAPFFVGFNSPRRRPILFQLWLMCSSWFWGWSEVIQMKVCHFYPTQDTHQNCGRKDFLFMMCYAVVVPTMALFALNQKRIFTTIGAIIHFILLMGLIIPDQTVFVRNVISFILMMTVFITVHYLQEKVSRRNFVLRAQMKVKHIAYKALQQSQIAEKQASNSKRRFVSYIFHEVRVPLNSAMLAYQNLQSNNAFERAQEDQAVEIHALEGSLTMMQQVLNDVLDLQRMDAGRFESSPSPFPFHVMIQSLLGSLGVAAAAKHLQLNVDLDERIDEQAAVAGQHNLQLGEKSLEGVWVVGDALRLRQILSNLGGNAVKFTEPDGGPITVKTVLIRPARSPASIGMGRLKSNGGTTPIGGDRSSKDLEAGVTMQHFMYPPGYDPDHAADTIIIRMEVTDSGPGIRPSELENSKLFTPFAQTKVGRSQAAKGSGLGLAIVRQIVALSGGRLGIISKKDSGSTFWIELGFRLATAQEILEQQQSSNGSMTLFPQPAITPASSASGSKSGAIRSTLQVGRPGLDPSAPSDLASTVVDEGSPDSKPLAASPSMEGPSKGSRLLVEKAPCLEEPPLIHGLSLHQPCDAITGSTPPIPPLTQHLSAPLPNEAEIVKPSPKPVPAFENPSPRSQAPNDPPLKVLVVDDDPLTRTLMTRMLTRLGCQVETAENGQLALDILLGDDTADRPPKLFDMISLDNAMPVMTGQEAVKRLRNAGRKDFVVGATGNALKLDQVAYIEAGADHVLAKPVMLKDVKAFLEIALNRRQAAGADVVTTAIDPPVGAGPRNRHVRVESNSK